MGAKFVKESLRLSRELSDLRKRVQIPRFEQPEDIGQIVDKLVGPYAPGREQITPSLTREQLRSRLMNPKRWDAKDMSLMGDTSKTGTSFGLPAGIPGHSGTCPTCNQSEVCRNCYTQNINYRQPDVIVGQLRRKAITQTPQFVPRMMRDVIYAATRKRQAELDEISTALKEENYSKDQIQHAQRTHITDFYVRGHDSGDFYSEDYIQKWIEIVRGVIDVIENLGLENVINIWYWFPTRVWTIKKFLPKLVELNSLKGVSIRPSAYSYDEAPPEVEGLDPGTNVAVQTRGDCPAVENAFTGEGEHTCEGLGCRRCWEGKGPISYGYHDPQGTRGALPNVSQLERLGYHRLVDKLLKMAQMDQCLFCGQPGGNCDCYQDEIVTLEEPQQEQDPVSQIMSTLQSWGVSNIQRPYPNIISYQRGKEIYVIDDFSDPDDFEIKEAHEWIWSLSDMDLDEYAPLPDFAKELWDSGGKVYHGTTEEKWEEIQRHGGLKPKNETRGMSNRGTGAAIFTSFRPEDTDYYGKVTLEIDLGQMIADDYMPEVSRETPINEAEQRRAIAHKLGIEDFYDESTSSEGYTEDTVIFYSDIPLKYIKRIEFGERPRGF